MEIGLGDFIREVEKHLGARPLRVFLWLGWVYAAIIAGRYALEALLWMINKVSLPGLASYMEWSTALTPVFTVINSIVLGAVFFYIIYDSITRRISRRNMRETMARVDAASDAVYKRYNILLNQRLLNQMYMRYMRNKLEDRVREVNSTIKAHLDEKDSP